MCHNLGFATTVLTLDANRFAALSMFLIACGLLLVSIAGILKHSPFPSFDNNMSANVGDFITVESELLDDWSCGLTLETDDFRAIATVLVAGRTVCERNVFSSEIIRWSTE